MFYRSIPLHLQCHPEPEGAFFMKSAFISSFILIFLISCTSVHTTREKEIALATQRLGEQYYNTGEYTAALKNLLEAQKTIPDDPFLNNSLGLAFLAKDRYDLAEAHFTKALSEKPDYIQARNNLGVAYMKQEKWTLAINAFQAVAGDILYATPEVPLSNLGWVYFNQKLYQKAEFYFKKSLEIQPGFLVSIHGLASTYLQTGAHDQALRYLNRHLKSNPEAAILHSDVAKVYTARHELDKARKAWQTVLNLVPETSPLALEARNQLDLLN